MAPRDPDRRRGSAIDMSPDEFRAAGHAAVDGIADLLARLRDLPVGPGEEPATVRRALGGRSVPRDGAPSDEIVARALRLLGSHSVFSGHPRFLAYVTPSPAPFGAVADLLAAGVNPNLRAWDVSPMASEIERQTVGWIAELLGYPRASAGLLTSGGTAANLIGLATARRWAEGRRGRRSGALRVYASPETHLWLERSVALLGLSPETIHSIPTDADQSMRIDALRDVIHLDRRAGRRPFAVVGNAGTTATGAVDPLPEISRLCRREGIWFHVDAAYGGFALLAPGAPRALAGLRRADSVAVDPHKWLYVPFEAGCALVREPTELRGTFSQRPTYYPEPPTAGTGVVDFFELGPQNSRGFRALKVWMVIQQVGRDGFSELIDRDLSLARSLAAHVRAEPTLELLTDRLSVVTFRYRPPTSGRRPPAAALVDRVNREILRRLNRGGRYFLSSALVDGRFALRACVLNFRTTEADVAELPPLVASLGSRIAAR